MYEIQFKDKIFDCWVAIEDDHREIEVTNATTTKLDSIGLVENDTMVMEYDTGSTTTFKITYLGEREFEKGNGMHYPYVLDGKGNGMIDDVTSDELKEIVEDIDKKGYSEHYLTGGYRGNRIYDYREFDLRRNNIHLRRYFSKFKRGYENYK